MMSQPIEQMLMRNSEDFLIPADIVANVQESAMRTIWKKMFKKKII